MKPLQIIIGLAAGILAGAVLAHSAALHETGKLRKATSELSNAVQADCRAVWLLMGPMTDPLMMPIDEGDAS